MKKKEVFRTFNFSDGELVTIGREKIAFIRRDIENFESYGITTTVIDEFENTIITFSSIATDVELVEEQKDVTTNKNKIADSLKEAIRGIMSRVVLKYPVASARYKKFGTEALSQQSDAQVLVIANRVFRVGTEMLEELAANGLTAEMLQEMKTTRDTMEQELINMNLKISDRDIDQESRVEAANAIYATLIRYTKTGQSIWASNNVAKYNDYVVYNTVSGQAPEETTPPSI